MSPTIKSLGIDRLTREERLVLVQEIWDSIAAEQAPLLSESQRQELERRAAEDDAAPEDVVSWEEVKAKALKGLPTPPIQ